MTSEEFRKHGHAVIDWMAELLDLPARFRSAGPGGGVIQSTASDATLCALLAAVHRASGGRSEQDGVAAGRYAMYTSGQSHSSVEKASRMAGLGSDALRKIDVDPETLAARPEHLRELIAADVAR